MEPGPSQPPPSSVAESDALAQLERIAAIVHASATPRVRARALSLLDQVARWPQIQQARREFGELVDRIHEHVRESGEPELTEEEIQAEIDAVRAEHAARASK